MTSVFTTSMKMRTFANDENEDEADEDESWTLVDAITGMGDRSWVVFDACDDARIGADASPRAFRFRLRTSVVETSPRDARETNASTSTSSSSSFARVAVIAATNHRRASASRRCARYARRVDEETTRLDAITHAHIYFYHSDSTRHRIERRTPLFCNNTRYRTSPPSRLSPRRSLARRSGLFPGGDVRIHRTRRVLRI